MPRQMSKLYQGQVLAPRPPLAAYREDLKRHGAGEAFGPSDATWISVATVLSHTVDLASDERPPLGQTVRDIVGSDPALRDILADAPTGSASEFELDAVSPIIRAIVDRMEDAGALHLGYSMLMTVARADMRLSVLERGRVLAQMGRVAWKAGALETSREHYRRTEVLGRAARVPELRVRAWIGYSIVARLRGNYPEARKWGARAAHDAERAGLTRLASLAYHSLMVGAAVAGDLNAAVTYGWRAYQGAIGERSREASALLQLSQTLLEAGHADAALRGFMACLEREPVARIAFPALGGLAVAAATVGQRALVFETKERIERLITIAPFPYECAAVLLELTQALAGIGDSAGAAVYRARALELAQRHAYHEIVHRLEAVRVASVGIRTEAPHVLDREGIEVARAVASLGFAGAGKGSE